MYYTIWVKDNRRPGKMRRHTINATSEQAKRIKSSLKEDFSMDAWIKPKRRESFTQDELDAIFT